MEDNRCPECGAPLHYIYAENIWVCPRCDVEDPPGEDEQQSSKEDKDGLKQRK